MTRPATQEEMDAWGVLLEVNDRRIAAFGEPLPLGHPIQPGHIQELQRGLAENSTQPLQDIPDSFGDADI